MYDLKWSGSEKKVARHAYDAARERLLAALVAEFKAKAAAVSTPSEMWAIEEYLRERGREIDQLLDYRYSVLPLVFAGLILRGHLAETELAGLSEEKLDVIRRVLSL